MPKLRVILIIRIQGLATLWLSVCTKELNQAWLHFTSSMFSPLSPGSDSLTALHYPVQRLTRRGRLLIKGNYAPGTFQSRRARQYMKSVLVGRTYCSHSRQNSRWKKNPDFHKKEKKSRKEDNKFDSNTFGRCSRRCRSTQKRRLFIWLLDWLIVAECLKSGQV